MANPNSLFQFKNELDTKDVAFNHTPKVWKILSVEDDLDYQQSLVASLKQLELPVNTELEILTASSAFDALTCINENPDIGVVLLDVVMEADDTGLQLVNIIREEIGNTAIRLLLLTGQAGFAPLKEVMRKYDIDEYWNKIDITADKLQSVIVSNFRTWQYINELTEARRGLSLVVEAARKLNNRYDVTSFTNTVLEEIGNIIGVIDGGLCCISKVAAFPSQSNIVCATGCFEHLIGQNILGSEENPVSNSLHKVSLAKTHIIEDQQSVLYFETSDIDEQEYIVVVKSVRSISQSDINLLKVFCENISSGFNSLALINKVSTLAYKHNDLDIPNLNWMQRELSNMSNLEWANTSLLMIEIHNFDEMKFTFGHEFVSNSFLLSYQRLTELLPAGSRIALTGYKYFSALVDSSLELTDSVIDKITKSKLTFEKVEHLATATLLKMNFSDVERQDSQHLFITGEALLKQATRDNEYYIEHSQTKTDKLAFRYNLLQDLRQAIHEKSISIALQPKVCLKTYEVLGFEALARWQRKDGSMVPPDSFIPVAEASGLILELDSMIVEKSIDAVAQLMQNGFEIPVAFNASTFDLVHSSYLDCVVENLKAKKVPANLVEIEITETEAITNYELIRHFLSKFAEAGIKISIDDFGTGYSSLSRISNIVADCIKIDRSFVSDLIDKDSNQHLVKMILDLAQKFDFSVVSEGIETKAQCEWLRKAGCEVGQGYYFAKPMPLETALDWLKQRDIEH